jgi:hypothetical protein
MDPAPARYMIRINGHLGATVLSAFPAMAPQQHGVLAEIDALGLDLLEARQLTQDRKSSEPGDSRSP